MRVRNWGRRSAARARRQWERRGLGGAWLWVLLGLACAFYTIQTLNARMSPMVSELTAAEAQNVVTSAIAETITAVLQTGDWDYRDMVTVQRDENGQITELHSNVAQANLLRAQVVEAVLEELSGLELREFDVPLGSLLDFDFFSGRGPCLRVRAISVGTVRAELQSDFSSAGINQTRHRLILEVTAPITIMIASTTVKTEVTTSVSVAETIIVGAVPDTYLQLPGGEAVREGSE